MTIREVFNKCQYGLEHMKIEKAKALLTENYDKETELFFAHQAIDDVMKTMFFEENSKVARYIDKIKIKLESVVNRLYDGKVLSEAYRRMTSSGIVDDYKVIIESLNSRIEFNKLSNKESLAKILAIAKYTTHKFVNQRAVFVESNNPVLNLSIKEELNIIGGIL